MQTTTMSQNVASTGIFLDEVRTMSHQMPINVVTTDVGIIAILKLRSRRLYLDFIVVIVFYKKGVFIPDDHYHGLLKGR